MTSATIFRQNITKTYSIGWSPNNKNWKPLALCPGAFEKLGSHLAGLDLGGLPAFLLVAFGTLPLGPAVCSRCFLGDLLTGTLSLPALGPAVCPGDLLTGTLPCDAEGVALLCDAEGAPLVWDNCDRIPPSYTLLAFSLDCSLCFLNYFPLCLVPSYTIIYI
ncbi:hypothetical protein FRX31_034573 [Thalictrum thalictroides]|uniref:Uncharacterized protein n=1 Tax=Thalictrum thalictroides TaxID=46969 RepID=A0A7J6UTE6_THATH|nr:hypothetical protein FRX31_034573 [Thalictrum thalictroides]